MPTRVLVTGGSGFIAGHCVLQLLARGHEVRATLRDPAREAAVRAVLRDAGMLHEEALTFVAADLLDDAGWPAAVADVDTVVHVASPVRPGRVEHEDDLVVPAREGTLRVLTAARDAGVRRVVLTSAFHAVGWGHPHDDHVFTEEDWTVLDGPGVDAYGRSKTLAERAAWTFAAENPLELVSLLPVAVVGPVLGGDVSGANRIVQGLLQGAPPVLPRLFFPVVDVRDVAAAHVAAVSTAEAAGRRFLLSNGPALEFAGSAAGLRSGLGTAAEFAGIAAVLRSGLGTAADAVPTEVLADEVVRAGAPTNPAFAAIVADLGYARRTSNEQARRVLHWEPRPAVEAVTAAGRSMVERGLV